MNRPTALLVACIAATGCATRPPPPQFMTAVTAQTAETNVCTQPDFRWVRCGVTAIGSLKKSSESRNRPLTTYWSSDCGCIQGQAKGNGEARWCESDATQPCGLRELLGTAIGRASNGRFEGGVELITILGHYQGSLNADGGYALGVLTRSNDEKFVGQFNSDGTYLSGSLYANNNIYLSNRFVGNRPTGTVLVGSPDGTFSILECTSSGCTEKQQGKSDALKNVWEALKKVAVGKATGVARKYLENSMPLLRRQPYAFAFDMAIQMALRALEDANAAAV